MDPEQAHRQITGLVELLGATHFRSLFFLPYRVNPKNFPALQQTLWNTVFPNPMGIAAGFDKHLQLASAFKALGFGFEEVGSISFLPWSGNPKPRLFRLPQDRAIINRMGLNNLGVEALLPKIKELQQLQWPFGVSLVKTPDASLMGQEGIEDMAEGFKSLYGLGTYVSINISCPNTAEGKTFEEPEALDMLLTRLREVEADCKALSSVSPRPWLLKISPDVSNQQLAELYEVASAYSVDGWIACNTSTQRQGLKTASKRLEEIGSGGLSGRPIRTRSTQVLQELYLLHQRKQDNMIFMGVGGIDGVDAAWEKIIHGASLVQVYTALVYEGPGLLKKCLTGLQQRCEMQGYDNIQQAVGSALG